MPSPTKSAPDGGPLSFIQMPQTNVETVKVRRADGVECIVRKADFDADTMILVDELDTEVVDVDDGDDDDLEED